MAIEVESPLPDVHALVRRAHHRRTIRNVKRFLEFRHVRERSVYTKLRWRMRVGGESELLIFVPNLRAPDRGEGQEEALLGGKAVDLFVAFLWMFVERFLQRGVSELHSSDICNVFALCQFAIDMLARQRLVRGI